MQRRMSDLRHQLQDSINLTVLYVDDGSRDRSREMLQQFNKEHEWVSVLFFTRNFGHQIAVTAGLDATTADYVAIIDGDLQDPPELVPVMIQQMINNGDHVVYGQRRSRNSESKFKRKTAELFYRLIRRISNLDIPLDTGDFRVMDRRAVDVLCSLREHNRFLRGLAPWTGLKSSPFLYDREDRYAGETKYTLKKMLMLAFNAIVTFSQTPLRLIQIVGVGITTMSSLALVLALLIPILGHEIELNTIFLMTNFVLMGVVVTCVGIVGGYVHRIQDEVRGRPLYVLEVEDD